MFYLGRVTKGSVGAPAGDAPEQRSEFLLYFFFFFCLTFLMPKLLLAFISGYRTRLSGTTGQPDPVLPQTQFPRECKPFLQFLLLLFISIKAL